MICYRGIKNGFTTSGVPVFTHTVLFDRIRRCFYPDIGGQIMRVYQIPPADVRNFMGKILREDILDAFAVRNVELTLLTHIAISGKREDDEEDKKYITWGEVRPMAYELIKNGAKPKNIKIVFSHVAPGEVHENAAALFLNFVYENDGATFTTATAQREFALDKSLDAAWDEWVEKYFADIKVTLERKTD